MYYIKSRDSIIIYHVDFQNDHKLTAEELCILLRAQKTEYAYDYLNGLTQEEIFQQSLVDEFLLEAINIINEGGDDEIHSNQ